jgi:hypothetical protein
LHGFPGKLYYAIREPVAGKKGERTKEEKRVIIISPSSFFLLQPLTKGKPHG